MLLKLCLHKKAICSKKNEPTGHKPPKGIRHATPMCVDTRAAFPFAAFMESPELLHGLRFGSTIAVSQTRDIAVIVNSEYGSPSRIHEGITVQKEYCACQQSSSLSLLIPFKGTATDANLRTGEPDFFASQQHSMAMTCLLRVALLSSSPFPLFSNGFA